ncbi:hypothetical protein NECAME_19203, partial [Necator americanus]
LVVISSWLAATAVALLSLYGPHDYMKGDNNWNKMVRGTYNNFSRIGWSLAVSWVIVANHLGWGGYKRMVDHVISSIHSPEFLLLTFKIYEVRIKK